MRERERERERERARETDRDFIETGRVTVSVSDGLSHSLFKAVSLFFSKPLPSPLLSVCI